MDELSKLAERPSLIRRVHMGAGHLPGYGSHPGTETVIFLTLLTGAAGAQAGWIGFAVGCGLGLFIYGPMWLCGCVGRANAFLRARAHTLSGEL